MELELEHLLSEFNFVQALLLFVLSVALSWTALRRHYPVRSLMFNAAMLGFATAGLLSAYGLAQARAGHQPNLEMLAGMAAITRGWTFVFMFALIVNERRNPKR